jgi:hypothetical protein
MKGFLYLLVFGESLAWGHGALVRTSVNPCTSSGGDSGVTALTRLDSILPQAMGDGLRTQFTLFEQNLHVSYDVERHDKVLRSLTLR